MFRNSGVCGPLPPAIRKEIPEVELSTTFWVKGEAKVNVPVSGGADKVFKKQSHIIWADDQYFRFMPYQWIAGSENTALKNPHEVVLTEGRALAYFPGTDINQCIGKSIVYDDSVQVQVVGIVKDLTEITDFTFKEFVSLSTFQKSLVDRHSYGQWGSISSSSQFLIRIKQGSNPKNIEKQIQDIRKRNAKKEYLQTNNYLQPLGDIHFNGEYDTFDQRVANRNALRGLVLVGAFLLILGCINFINLSTAQSARRAREIGIRKTMGSSITQLIFQFLAKPLF
jgi:hypothetical protein